MKKNILVIEDEINLAKGLKNILEKDGYNITQTSDYSNIKRLIEIYLPHLVITNINIPKIFGLNLLFKIKELFPLLPIIVMSVYSNSFNEKELLDLA